MMKFLCTLFLLFTLFLSCSKRNIPTNNFKENIIIHLNENEAGALELQCRTEKIFECANFTIVHYEVVKNNTAEIHFTDIHKPPICLTALGPATATVDLGKLNNGTYKVNINNGNQFILGTLEVTRAKFMLDLQPQASVVVENKVLER